MTGQLKMKICQKSLVLRKCKLNHNQNSYTPSGMTKIKRLTTAGADQDVEELQLANTTDGSIIWYNVFEK